VIREKYEMTQSFLVKALAFAAVGAIAVGAPCQAEMPTNPEDFPAVEKLPDPFLFLDGSRVRSKEDWARRRAEIQDLILRIQYGHLPPAPKNVKLKRLFAQEMLNDGTTRLEKHVLSMGPQNRMRAQLDLYFPAKMQGPCPVILRVGWGCPIISEVNERGYIFAGFGPDRFDRSEMGKPRPGAVERFYPENDGGTLAAWAWGASRMLDYLETLPQVDASKVIITGHSRCGKAAILAGAVDERFAMVVPNGSGCGGLGLYRILGPDCEDLEAITQPERWQEWFHKNFRDYAGKEAHLPFDQHFMRALVAPRPVLNTDGTDDTWANPIGEQINYLAAQPVYDFLGVPKRNGIHFRSGGHGHNEEDFRALLDFADWHLFGKKPKTEFNKLPFPEHRLEVDWETPSQGHDAKTPAAAVRPIDFSRFDKALTAECRQCLEVLSNCIYYNLRWAKKAIEADAAGRSYVHKDMGEKGIRPSCSVIYALGVALGTGVYDEQTAKVLRSEALRRTTWLIRGVTSIHITNSREKGWEDQWQSALWASLMGLGSWMIWEDLDTETRERVVPVIIHEADRFIVDGYQVPYWNGKRGDTKGEENAWNSMVLNVAIAMLPDHPHAAAWKRISSELMISAYATKLDWRENETTVDGRPVKDWLNGFNARVDGMVLNHGFIHPDYAVAMTMNLWAYLTCSLANEPVSQTAAHNGPLIYRTLNTKEWPSPPYEAPGGTIYKRGKAAIYYPRGVDWSTCDVSPYYLMDAWAHVLDWDEGLPTPAAEWLRLRGNEMLRMQARHDDRRMFGPGEYDTYEGCEQWVSWCIADALLALWLDSQKALRDTGNWLARE